MTSKARLDKEIAWALRKCAGGTPPGAVAPHVLAAFAAYLRAVEPVEVFGEDGAGHADWTATLDRVAAELEGRLGGG